MILVIIVNINNKIYVHIFKINQNFAQLFSRYNRTLFLANFHCSSAYQRVWAENFKFDIKKIDKPNNYEFFRISYLKLQLEFHIFKFEVADNNFFFLSAV